VEVACHGTTATLRTDRYELDWRDGSAVRLVSLVPARAPVTLAQPAMTVGQLPNGIASLHGHEQAAREQHHIWRAAPLPVSFPAQHPPCAATEVEFERIDGGVRIAHRGLDGDAGAVLTQDLTVDARTGDLVVSQRGVSPDPGVIGIAFSLLNLRPDVTLAAPYMCGQRWGREWDKGMLRSIAWARFWSAGFVIGEIPGGGSFMVWADDPGMHPKYLHRYNNGTVQGLSFEACEDHPYRDRRTAAPFAWRFNTFAGGWMAAARRYRDWAIAVYGLTPRAKRSPAWMDDVSLIWWSHLREDELRRVAELIPPEHVLLFHSATFENLNRRVPEYAPTEKGFAEKAAAARRLGFRVAIYTSLMLVDVEAHPNVMEEFGLRFERYEPWLTDVHTYRTAPYLRHIHPGPRKWQDFYAGRMRMLHDKYGIDAFYQDVTGGAHGSSGVLEGQTLAKAVTNCEDRIRKAVPQAALLGEYWSEINLCREDIGTGGIINWGEEDHRRAVCTRPRPHPVMGFIFGDYCYRWASGLTTQRSRFHLNENVNEVTGALPCMRGRAGDRSGEARIILERARLWAAGFRPHFPESWEDGVAAYLRNEGGELVRYVTKGDSTYCFRDAASGRRLVYGRVHGEKRVSIGQPVSVDNWVAYDEHGPFGLDPEKWHCVFPGEPAEQPLTVTQAPRGAVIAGCRLAERFWLLQLSGEGEGELRWRSEAPLLSVCSGAARVVGDTDRVRVRLPGSVVTALQPPQRHDDLLPLQEWDRHVVIDGVIARRSAGARMAVKHEGLDIAGCRMVPPTGGAGAEASLDACIALPAGPGLVLTAYAGLQYGREQAANADGAHFVVRVNGRELWRSRHEPAPRSLERVSLSLAEFAGRDVVLSLAADCGPSGHKCNGDHCFWGGVRIGLGAGTLTDTDGHGLPQE